MTCHAPTASHDGSDVRLYVNPNTRRRFTLCRGCWSVIDAMGLALIEDRRSDPEREDRWSFLRRRAA